MLEELGEGLRSRKVPRPVAIQRLADIKDAISNERECSGKFRDSNVRESVREHYELALKETYEFLEEHGLAIDEVNSTSGQAKSPRFSR
jgi:hypothetical protein